MQGARTALIAICLTILLAGGLSADTARRYLGPFGDSPHGLHPPTPGGPIGAARLTSASRETEGLARWEFWWEMNRDSYLRAAMAANARADAVTVSDAAFAIGPPPVPSISSEDVRDLILPLLIDGLGSSDPERRLLAALLAGQVGDPAAFMPLRELVRKGGPDDRQAASFGLGLLGDPLAASVLLSTIGRRGTPSGRKAVPALALGFSGAAESAEQLEHALRLSLDGVGNSVSEFQAASAVSLGLLGQRRSLPLLATLARGSLTRSVSVRVAAIRAIGMIGDEAAVSVLLPLIDDGRAEVRRAVVGALTRLRSPLSRSALVKRLEGDGDTLTRALAAVALARLRGEESRTALLAHLGPDSPRALRGYAVLSLGLLGDRASAPILRGLLHARGEASIRGAAAVALGLQRDAVAAPVLRQIAANAAEDDDLRGYAALSLAMMGDPVTRNRLARFARKPGAAALRRSATLALALYPGLDADRALLGSLLEEGDPLVRGAAIESLSLRPRRGLLEPLLSVVRFSSFTREARSDAFAALGALARMGRPSPLERLRDGGNGAEFTRTLFWAASRL